MYKPLWITAASYISTINPFHMEMPYIGEAKTQKKRERNIVYIK